MSDPILDNPKCMWSIQSLMYNLYPVASRDASPIFKLILYLQFRHFDIEERVFICRNLVDMITNHSHIFPSPNLYEDACKDINDILTQLETNYDQYDLNAEEDIAWYNDLETFYQYEDIGIKPYG